MIHLSGSCLTFPTYLRNNWFSQSVWLNLTDYQILCEARMRKWSRPKVKNNVGCLGMDVGGGVAEGQTHFPEQRQEGFQGWPILLNKHDRKININSSKKSPGHKINITSSSCWSKIQYFFYMGKCKSYYFPSSISTIWIWSKAAPCNNKSSSLDFDKMWSSFPPTHP